MKCIRYYLSDSFSGLLGMVKGHLGEEMVADVCVGDVVKSVVQNGTEGSVDSAERSSQPGPLLVAEVGHEHVRMLQVGDEHQMVVGHCVGDQIVCGHCSEAVYIRAGCE